MIVSNPSQPHTVMITSDGIAPCGESNHPNGPSPILPSAKFAMPKFASNTHRNITPVAIVETATGMKTASR